MPIRPEIRSEALAYVDRHLIDEISIRDGFSFIGRPELVDLIVLELRSARYIYRLIEMLDLKDTFSHPFCKFQIVQYAGVFEAAIDYLIFEKTYSNSALQRKVEAARAELEKHEALTAVSALASNTKLTVGVNNAVVAVLKRGKKSRPNIRFDAILDECQKLSFIDTKLSAEISEFYAKRHSVHLSARIKNAITVELRDTKRGFRRVNGLCENVKRGLRMHGEPVSTGVPPP